MVFGLAQMLQFLKRARKKFTEHLSAITAASEILISLAFAGLFFLLLKGGYAAIGGAGLSMCVIGSFFGTFPFSPMSGRDIFGPSKPLWVSLFHCFTNCLCSLAAGLKLNLLELENSNEFARG